MKGQRTAQIHKDLAYLLARVIKESPILFSNKNRKQRTHALDSVLSKENGNHSNTSKQEPSVQYKTRKQRTITLKQFQEERMENVAFSQRKGKTKRRRRRRKREGENTINEEQPSLPNVPEEVILQILQRLPLSSLSRFTSVSKTWFSLISNFFGKKRGREMVLVVSHDLLHSIDLENYDGERLYESEEVTNRKFRAIYGSCNGLILMDVGQDLFLWNPLTKYFKKGLRYDGCYFRTSKIVSRLCFDSSTDDYKVVMVVEEDFGSENVVVGSIKSKSWTKVYCSSYTIGLFNSGPTVNEHLHWYVSEDGDLDYGEENFVPSQILYFHTQMGTFENVPMPQSKQSHGDVVYGLGVLDGCLCMSRSENPSNRKNNIEVLVMKEYGVANSWTLMFTISNLRSFGYTRKGEALALKVPPPKEREGIWHISAYNPIDDSTCDIPIPTPMSRNTCNDVKAIMYEESLVKPTDYNWEDEDRREEATYVEYFLDGSHEIWKIERCTYWRRQVKRLERPTRLPEECGQ